MVYLKSNFNSFLYFYLLNLAALFLHNGLTSNVLAYHSVLTVPTLLRSSPTGPQMP